MKGLVAYLGGVGDVLELTVPVVFALDEGASVQLSALQLHRHDVPLRFMKELHGNA